ncbi:reverse transcriptase domain-containing protein, partial [Tanacetum coccineum]
TISMNRCLIQAIPISLPLQQIGEATKASNLQRIPPGVQGRSPFTYFLYLIVQIMNPGPIPGIRPAEALTAIQTMADHSQNWHDGSTSRNIESSSSKDGLAALVNKTSPRQGLSPQRVKVQVHHETAEEVLKHLGSTNSMEYSFISDPESHTTEVLQHQLPRKELNPGNFTLPCKIGKFNFYAMADLGVSINVMPTSIFEHLHLTNLRKTNMLCEMADISKKAPL